MMYTGSSHMTDSPHRQKESQQQTGFQPPSSTFAILESRLDTHTQCILLHTPFACFLVGNQDPAFLVALPPAGTHRRFNRVFLPDFGPPIPLLSCFLYKYIKTAPCAPAFAHFALTGVFFAHAQERVPSTIAANLHQWETRSPSIRNQGAVSLLQMRDDLI